MGKDRDVMHPVAARWCWGAVVAAGLGCCAFPPPEGTSSGPSPRRARLPGDGAAAREATLARLQMRSSRITRYRAEYVGQGPDGAVRVRVAFRAPYDYRVDMVTSQKTYLVNARHFQWADLKKASLVRYPLDRFSKLATELQVAFGQLGLGANASGTGSTARGSAKGLRLQPRLRLQATPQGVVSEFSLHFKPTPPPWVDLVRKASKVQISRTPGQLLIRLERRQLTFNRHTGLLVAEVLKDEAGQVLSEWRLLRLELSPTLADHDFDGSDLKGVTVTTRPLPATARKRMSREIFEYLLRWSTSVLAKRWSALTSARRISIRAAMTAYYSRWVERRTKELFQKSTLPLLKGASGCAALRTSFDKGGLAALIAKAPNPQRKTEEMALRFAVGLAKKLYTVATKGLARELAKGLAQVRHILGAIPGATPSTRKAILQLHRQAFRGGFSPKHYRVQARQLVPTIVRCWSQPPP